MTLHVGKLALVSLLSLHYVRYSVNAYPASIVHQNVRTSITPLHLNNEECISFESAVKGGWKPTRGTFVGINRKSIYSSRRSIRKMSDTNGAVMPDGGLSPCIIKVIGVGGGGCNAVSRSMNVTVKGLRITGEKLRQHLTLLTHFSS